MNHVSSASHEGKERTCTYHTTGHTTTTRMLPVLSNATLTGTDVAAVLACLGESSRHLGGCRDVVVIWGVYVFEIDYYFFAFSFFSGDGGGCYKTIMGQGIVT